MRERTCFFVAVLYCMLWMPSLEKHSSCVGRQVPGSLAKYLRSYFQSQNLYEFQFRPTASH